MSVLMVATLTVSIPAIFGKELTFRREASLTSDIASEDSERQPLLDDDE